MRRTSVAAIAAGAAAVMVMVLALLAPAPVARAAQTSPTTTSTTKSPTLVEAVCGKLPTLLQSVSANLPVATSALDAARQNVEAKRAAMTSAMTEMATAVVDHLAVLDGGGNPSATGSTLKAKQAAYVNAVVAWSKARTQLFDGEQLLIFGELQKTLLDSVAGTAC